MGMFIQLVREDPRGEYNGWSEAVGPVIDCSYGDWMTVEETLAECVPGMRNSLTLGTDGICFDREAIRRELKEVSDCGFESALAENRWLDRYEKRHINLQYTIYKEMLKEAVEKDCLIRFA